MEVELYKQKSFNSNSKTLELLAIGIIKGKRIYIKESTASEFIEKNDFYYFSDFYILNLDQFVANVEVNVSLKTNIPKTHIYCNLSRWQLFKLKRRFKKHWYQKPENKKYLLTTVISVGSLIVSIIAIILAIIALQAQQ